MLSNIYSFQRSLVSSVSASLPVAELFLYSAIRFPHLTFHLYATPFEPNKGILFSVLKIVRRSLLFTSFSCFEGHSEVTVVYRTHFLHFSTEHLFVTAVCRPLEIFFIFLKSEFSSRIFKKEFEFHVFPDLGSFLTESFIKLFKHNNVTRNRSCYNMEPKTYTFFSEKCPFKIPTEHSEPVSRKVAKWAVL